MNPPPERPRSNLRKTGAFMVHVLTASGVAFGLLALFAATERRWTAMFVWLGVALFVDAIDGPLARRARVTEVLPQWSGEVLDLVVDYLNYVLVPAFALATSGILPQPYGLIAAAAILVTSALYFADTRMKTEDAYFRGFPAVWNVVVLYLFVFRPDPLLAGGIVAVLCVLTFVPFPFLHPVRVRRFRGLTLAILAAWALLCAIVLIYDLAPPDAVRIAFLAAGLYFLFAGLTRPRST
jgi:phosphatidylcholine synthase